MTVQLSKSEMAKIAESCDDVEDGVVGTGTTVAGQDKPGLTGFLLASAVADVNGHWTKKAEHSGSQWRYFASAVRATAAEITGTDSDAAFTFPKVGKNETDIPLAMPFGLFVPPTGN